MLAALVLTFAFQAPFDDGGTLSGTFSFDKQSNQITTWDIKATGGLEDPFEYTPLDSVFITGDSQTLDLHPNFGTVPIRRLRISFQHNLGPGLNGPDPVIYPMDSFETVYATDTTRFLDPDTRAISLAVPEPASWLFLLLLVGKQLKEAAGVYGSKIYNRRASCGSISKT